MPNAPFLPYPKAVLDYSLYTFGYHFGDAVMHAFVDERHNDFAEMFLHHIATCTLYFGYILANFLGIGSIIAFLHDIADIPVQITKFLDALGFKLVTKLSFLIMMIVWFYTRCMILPTLIHFIVTELRYPNDRS
jgi:hypothetical protein